jgi:tRNA pseudouridine38-40 synthase
MPSPFERHYAWHLPGVLDVEAMRQAAPGLEGTHDFAAFQSAGGEIITTVRDVIASSVATSSTTERTTTEPTETDGEHGKESGFPVFSVDHDPAGDLRGGVLIVYEITGTGFLRHMVRAIVGSLVEIGRGRQPVEWLAHVLESRERAKAGPTAPAHGLFLVGVDYRDGGA